MSTTHIQLYIYITYHVSSVDPSLDFTVWPELGDCQDKNQTNMGQTGAGVLSSGQSNIVLPTTCYISILYMYVYCILYKFMGNVSK